MKKGSKRGNAHRRAFSLRDHPKETSTKDFEDDDDEIELRAYSAKADLRNNKLNAYIRELNEIKLRGYKGPIPNYGGSEDSTDNPYNNEHGHDLFN